MNYKIIQNEEKLIEFINWLPEISEDECYYLTLFARKKYDPTIKSDKAQLKTIITNKEYMLRKIKQLEVEVGNYEFDGIPVSQESLVLYITTPRSYAKANRSIVKELTNYLFDKTDKPIPNPYRLSLKYLQTAKSNHKIFLFDIDSKLSKLSNFDNEDGRFIDHIKDWLNSNAYSVIKTRGGYRIVIYTDLIDDKSKEMRFYDKFERISDQVGDLFIPVVGCAQGGFIPYFVKR